MQELILAPIYRWGNKGLPESKGKQGEVGKRESGIVALGSASPLCYITCTNDTFLEITFVSIPHFMYVSDYQEGKIEEKRSHLLGFSRFLSLIDNFTLSSHQNKGTL